MLSVYFHLCSVIEGQVYCISHELSQKTYRPYERIKSIYSSVIEFQSRSYSPTGKTLIQFNLIGVRKEGVYFYVLTCILENALPFSSQNGLHYIFVTTTKYLMQLIV